MHAPSFFGRRGRRANAHGRNPSASHFCSAQGRRGRAVRHPPVSNVVLGDVTRAQSEGAQWVQHGFLIAQSLAACAGERAKGRKRGVFAPHIGTLWFRIAQRCPVTFSSPRVPCVRRANSTRPAGYSGAAQSGSNAELTSARPPTSVSLFPSLAMAELAHVLHPPPSEACAGGCASPTPSAASSEDENAQTPNGLSARTAPPKRGAATAPVVRRVTGPAPCGRGPQLRPRPAAAPLHLWWLASRTRCSPARWRPVSPPVSPPSPSPPPPLPLPLPPPGPPGFLLVNTTEGMTEAMLGVLTDAVMTRLVQAASSP